jgi:mandelamide amidase
MEEYESLSHTKWKCKYHVAFIQKCRRKALYVELRKYLGEVFRHLAQQEESRIEEGMATLRKSGCVLVEADIPDLEELYTAARQPISYYEMFHDLSRYLEESGAKVEAKEVIAQIASHDVKAAYLTFGIGPKASTRKEYETAMKHDRPAIQACYRNYFRAHNVPAIVFPTTILPARPIGRDDGVELNGKRFPTLAIYIHNTRPMTVTGIPGMSLPVGLTADGRPVGLELDAPEGTDRNLLGLGLAIERLFRKLPSPQG